MAGNQQARKKCGSQFKYDTMLKMHKSWKGKKMHKRCLVKTTQREFAYFFIRILMNI